MSDDQKVVVWSVEFSSQSESKYRWNGYVTVVSDTIQRAIALLFSKYPDAVIHAIHKRSRGELIVGPGLTFEQ